MGVQGRVRRLRVRSGATAGVAAGAAHPRRSCRPASSQQAFAAAGATAGAAYYGMLGARVLLGQLIQTGFGANLEWARSARPGHSAGLNTCRPVMPEVAGSSPSLP